MKRILLTLLLLATIVRADAPESLYQLEMTLTDQSGAQHRLDMYRGHPVFVTLFYGSCPMACPMLIDTMRSIERAATPLERTRIRFLLISIDPERDQVANLNALATSRKLDTSRWTLARTDEMSVRKIAAALGVQYRRLPNGSYNHSSVVTLLTSEGEIAHQSSVLGRPDPELLASLERTVHDGKTRRP